MSEPFYKNGLRFECTRCNACCRYEPGYVFLSERDIERLLAATGTDREEFLRLYCRIVEIDGERLISLKEKANYDCVFWDGGCTVYAHRPLQCRAFPFWPGNVSSRSSWKSLTASCPGVNRGKLHSREEIEEWLAARVADPVVKLNAAEEPE